ncbi:hypothetical protein BVRB_4g086060 [Beta vulgaris subsp. vulgaris]|nr:hypothetical protein BVRB_4g086060 [Beta vulgaris subsp. vulgaris]
MADWSMLPDDVLGEIALRLSCIKEFIYFSAVCHSWHHAHGMVKELWTFEMPWLLLAETTEDNPNHYRKLFCPINKRCYQIKLPETFGARCWGSSCGWVVTFDLNLEFHLLNPLTKARISLPPQPTMPHYDVFDGNDSHWMRQYYVDKAHVLIDAERDSDDDWIVIASHGCFDGYIAYVRPGDQAWTPLVNSEINKGDTVRARAHDVVQWGSQLLIMFYEGTLGYCDMSALRDSQPAMIMEYLPAPLEILEELRLGLYRIYLVESFGDLLMVLRYKEEVHDPNDPTEWDYTVCYRTVGFEVYKLNFGAKTWEEVDDLGDVAIFVGNNSSMSVHASGTYNCKCNCVYFTDDEWQFWGEPTLFGGHDIGLYDMENSVIEKVYDGDDVHSSFCAPLWFMPKKI